MHDDQRFMDIFHAEREILTYIRTIFLVLSFYCFSDAYARFADYLLRPESDHAVINFNWDFLLEQTLLDTRRWDPRVNLGVDNVQIVGTELILDDGPKPIPILKPHGSCNWYQMESQLRFFNFPPRHLRGGFGNFPGEFMDTAQVSMQPPAQAIRPDNAIYNEIWGRIRSQFQKAQEIVIIGFAFNHNDQDVRSEFERVALNQAVRITVVNPANGEERQNLEQTLITVWPRRRIEYR